MSKIKLTPHFKSKNKYFGTYHSTGKGGEGTGGSREGRSGGKRGEEKRSREGKGKEEGER